MVEVAGANRMMPGVVMAGSAESGYGIKLSGFFCPTAEFAQKVQDLFAKLGTMNEFAQFEENGYVMFLAMKRESYQIPVDRKVITFRRSPDKFFQDLPGFLSKSKAQFVDRMILTGSLGSISLTLLYRPVSETGV